MSFKSHIYDRSKIEEKGEPALFILFLILLLLLGYLLLDLSNSLGSAIIWLSLLGFVINIIKNWVKKEPEGEYVSELIMTGDKIALDKKSIKTSEISEMKIIIGHPKGYKYRHRYGYTVCSGTRNKIELVSDGQKLIFNFQLFSNLHLKDLKQILEQWYINGIFINEYYLGQRSFLLKNLNYKEIQDFKKKYRLH